MLTKKIIILSFAFLLSCSSIVTNLNENSWAESVIKKMTLREKIAQMMVYRMNMHYVNFENKDWKELIQLIETDGIGIIHIWFGDVGSSLTTLNFLQQKSKLPILVEADIESGLGRRYNGSVRLPPMMAIAATGNSYYAYEAGRISAEESRAVGIHFNLAPVVDVNNNPKNPIINTRSFGEVPDSVQKYSKDFIKGLKDFGMLTTAKHFPGHGDTETDSHSALALIPSDSARLWNIELPPFRYAIEAGVDAVMIAHVSAPDFQRHSEVPASLSSFWIQDILRKEMSFNGAVITDAMGMGGIIKNYSDDYAIVETIKAGSDIIIQNDRLSHFIDVIEKAVLENEIDEDQINQSALKVLKMKEKIGLHKERLINSYNTHRTIGKKDNFLVADQIASKSITLVKNTKQILPLSPEIDEDLYVIDLYDGANNHNESHFTKTLKQSGRKVKSFQLDKSDSLVVANHILDQIPSDVTVFLNAHANPVEWKENIFLPEVEADFINRIIEKCENLIITSFGSPYLIMDFPKASTYLCAYSSNQLQQNAAVNALMGKNSIQGILPVTIPEIAIRGTGINIEPKEWKAKEKKIEPGKELIRIRPDEIDVDISSINQMLKEAVSDSAFPGGVILAAKDGQIFLHQSFGYKTYQQTEPMVRGSIFDLASITKVVSTTSAVMFLVDRNKINLDDKIIKYLPEFSSNNSLSKKVKDNITIRDLMTHSSGLPPFKKYYLMDSNVESRIDSVMKTDPEFDRHEKTVYSDVGLIVLGILIEKVSGKPLNQYVDSLLFDPLGMNSSFFNPPKNKLKRVVPTEISAITNEVILGYVHDENAFSIGGVAGHAGLFSTAMDIAKFSQMMLNNGLYGWKRFFKPETVNLFTMKANIVKESSRALGWDTPAGKSSGGVYLSDSSFGHTGFTGTSLWIDPDKNLFVILLTNAVHPKREYKNPKYFDWRQRIHSSVYELLKFNSVNPNLEFRDRWK